MSELKPCPFCKGEAELLTFWDFYKFSCKNEDCQAHVADAPYVQHAEGVWYGSIGEARAAWNSRAERTCECVAEYAKSPIDGKTIVLHRCSACHELMRPHMAYCPNCGAKVVGE